jgi:hypothetical protein
MFGTAMNNLHEYQNIRLVKTDDPDYIAHMRRMADQRPSRGGPRHAGEYLGGLVERCVRHWLSKHVPLQEERILAWEQRQRNGRYGPVFRELDAVWTIDEESLCLFEMKLTFAENMARGVGLRQLDIATQTLFATGRYKYILQRLVYVAAEPIPVLDDPEDTEIGEGGLPSLEPNDEYEELGVVWVKPEAVMAAAQELEIELPENWLEPESREGYVEDPEREAWREFADTEARKPDVPEEEPAPDNPLAQALRKALKQND